MSPPLFIISRRFTHHGRYSGYDRITAYMPEARVIRPPSTRDFRGRDRLRGWLSRRVAPKFYDWPDLVAEARVALASGAGHPIWHFLYGEDQLALTRHLRLASGATTVATVHQPPLHADRLMRHFTPWASLQGLIAVAGNQIPHLIHHAPGVPRRVIPHGVDSKFFTPGTRSVTLAPATKLRVLIVGQWLRDLDLAARVAAALPSDRFAFRYVGPLAAAARLADSPVELSTALDDAALRQAYRDADVLWLPLLDATANNSLLEALACGLPVIAPDLGGLSDYAAHGGVHLYPRTEHEAALQAVSYDLLARLRLSARPAAERFAWPRVASAMRSFYADIVREPTTAV